MQTRPRGFALALMFLAPTATILILTAPLCGQAFASAPADEVEFLPHWVQAEWELRANSGGHWITDNTPNKSDAEPYDAYGMEWTWGLGKKTLEGRLYAIRQGKDVGSLFEYRLMWHPGEKQVVVTQYGSDGTYAVGTVTPVGEKRTEALQRFFHPEGRSHQIGHRVMIDGDDMEMQSYTVSEEGAWTEMRHYLWKRVGQAPPKLAP